MMLNGSILLGFDGSILDFDTALKREDDENHHHHHHVQNLIEEEVDEVEEEENIEHQEIGSIVNLWDYEWRREITKEGKQVLITTLPDEAEYDRFMKRFEVDDLKEGFYWVTDRGRKFSKAVSSVMQRMRWKDTFNCFYGRRHTKSRRGSSPDQLHNNIGHSDSRSCSNCADGHGCCDTNGLKTEKHQNDLKGPCADGCSKEKVYCPASLCATCLTNGKVELRYYDSHIQHPVPENGRLKRKRMEDRGTRRIKVLDNEHVKAWKAVIKPNQPIKLRHSDIDRMMYVLKGGRLKVVDRNNEVKKTYNLQKDKAYWLPKDGPGEVSADINEGPEPIHVLVVEIESTKDSTNAMDFGLA